MAQGMWVEAGDVRSLGHLPDDIVNGGMRDSLLLLVPAPEERIARVDGSWATS